MSILPLILLFASALFVGAGVLAIIVAMRALQERRITIFPVVKETETLKLKRALGAAGLFAVLAAVSIGGWTATQQNPENILRAKHATEQVLAAAPIRPPVTPPASPTPNIIGENTGITPAPPVTPTAAPTATIAVIPTSAGTHTPIPDGLSMGPISFALKVSDRREPIDPSDTFNGVPERIYAVFPYSGMKNGLPFSVIWYYQDRELVRNEYIWKWGTIDRSFAFMSPVGSGTYRVVLQVANTTVAENSFEITQ